MAKLILNNLSRNETDLSIIENLQRKGWTLVVDPVAPEYDATSQKLTFDSETNEYIIINLSPEEIQGRKDFQDSVDAANLLAQEQKIIQDSINAGYSVSPEGFVLGLGDIDRSLFTQMISLIREALDLGLITNDTLQTITDIDNKEMTLSTLRFRQIMVGYGMYYKGLWDQMA